MCNVRVDLPDSHARQALRNVEVKCVPEQRHRDTHEDRTECGPESPEDRDADHPKACSAEIDLREDAEVLQQYGKLAEAQSSVVTPLGCPEPHGHVGEIRRIGLPLERLGQQRETGSFRLLWV